MICFYHNDNDGKFAAACVYHLLYCDDKLAYKKKSGFRAFEINYNMSFPFDIIQDDEEVWIVDYSIKPDEMMRLLDITENVVWIDHHKTAIEKYEDFQYEVKGVCSVDDGAACKLTYAYIKWLKEFYWLGTIKTFNSFLKEIKSSLVLEYVSDRDTWTWLHGDTTKYVHAGLQTQDLHPMSDFMKVCVEDRADVSDIVKDGTSIEKYRKNFFEDYRRSWMYEVEFEGYDCCVMNLAMCGSEAFGDLVEKYDILISYAFNGERFIVSLYSEKVDVSDIAKKYGGGGHKGASGFVCNELPFTNKGVVEIK